MIETISFGINVWTWLVLNLLYYNLRCEVIYALESLGSCFVASIDFDVYKFDLLVLYYDLWLLVDEAIPRV
jgi:hypothetical protein